MSLKIYQSRALKNKCYIQNKKRTPIGIQIHSIGTAQGTGSALCSYFNQANVDACVTYVVDADEPGRVYQLLQEDTYSWADGGYGNRNLITIEICESDWMKYTGGANFTITDESKFIEDILRGYDTAVLLCADICKRYKWNPKTKLASGLFLISSHDEGRIAGLSTAHVDPTHIWTKVGLSMDTFRQAVENALNGKYAGASDIPKACWYRVRKTWKDAESQLGAFSDLNLARSACPYGYKVFDWNGNEVYKNATKPKNTQASAFNNLSEGDAAEKILELVHLNDKSGILFSVSAAQMILESGYVKTNLSKIANNCFGMKVDLSGNSWESVWDGKSYVETLTQEVYNGKTVTITAKFRKYPSIEDSIKDHSLYILGAMNGKKKRYDGILKAKNYTEATTLIKNGGYATDPSYISKITSIIQRFNLDRYDKEIAPVEVIQKTEEVKGEKLQKGLYYVQLGAYKIESYAKARATTLSKEGFATQIKFVDGMYLVICGVFKVKKNALNRVKKLKEAGFTSLVKSV